MKKPRTAFKKNLIAGLLLIIPTGLTFFLFSFVINILDQALDPLIAQVLQRLGFQFGSDFHIPGLGFIIVFLLIFIIGLATKNFFGRTLVTYWNQTVIRIPFVRSIYLTIKRIMDTVTLTDAISFQKVVILDYPREGLRGLGVICCEAKGEVATHFQNDPVCVFIPTTPNPTTGFTVIVPREKIIPLDSPVDQAFKMIVSVGMFNPSKESQKGSSVLTSGKEIDRIKPNNF